MPCRHCANAKRLLDGSPDVSPDKIDGVEVSPTRSSQKKMALEGSESEPGDGVNERADVTGQAHRVRIEEVEILSNATPQLSLVEEPDEAIPSTYVVASVRAAPEALRVDFVE
ncbi:hypothetical protein AaE_012655 [Aphanomyces astaci]|uniref:Uncharacterized protein n=1 Tax=Aphanomyces astaci TaxID=112090 RepID=A0A6A4ZM36_APHAT|nr:hypothetical protein AaE_012655 [Aphanomyces astaci]